MPEDRHLTDADIAAISAAIQQHSNCSAFTHDEVTFIRDFIKLLHETRSNILKGVLSLLVIGFVTIVALGFKVWVKQ